MKKIFVFLSAVLLVFISVVNLKAQEPVIIKDGNGKYPVNFEYLFDSDNNLTIDKISSKDFSGKFEKCGKSGINHNFIKVPIWVRLSIQNETDIEDFFLEYAWSMAKEVYLFTPDDLGLFNESNVKKCGYLIPFNDREINHRNSVFPIVCKNGETKTYYLKIVARELELRFTIWDKKVFYKEDSLVQLIFGLLFGMLIIMIFYNLFLFISTRDISYFFFIFYIMAITLFQLCYTGIMQLFFEDLVFLERIYYFSSCFIHLSLLLMTRSFLNTKKNFKRLNKLLLTFIYLFLTLLPFLFAPENILFYAMMFVNLFSTIPYFLGLSISLFVLFVFGKKRVISKYIIIFIWLALLYGVTFSLMKFNIIPSNIITQNALFFSTIIEILFISFAFADKLNIMRKEKENAQELAIHNHQLAIENLRKADALKDEFLANTSHELRTPLNGIIGITDTLIENNSDNISQKAIEQLSLINISSRRLYTLINDILDYSRLKHSDIKLYKKNVDIKRITDVVIMLCKSLTIGKSLVLLNGISDEIPYVDADENRLQQILYNLIGNAIKFTDSGSVSISAEKDDSIIKVIVADTGIGVPKGKEEEIFNAFENSDAMGRNSSGIGLGLNITKKLVELHNGKIWVESNNGGGSKFIFTLPMSNDRKIIDNEHLKEITDNISPLETPVEIEPIRKENPSANILVVDDELMNVKIVLNALQDTNYNVVAAYNGQQALNLITENNNYDLILLDVMMPILSGFDVCKELRKQYLMFELPIVILTAKNSINDIITGFQIGVNDYIQKPFNKEELLARIDTQINLKFYVNELNQLKETLEERVKERTEALQEQTIRLGKANEELRMFSSIVAHDLQNPLNLIDYSIQKMQMNTNYENLDKNIKDNILKIHNVEQKMIQIINSMLKLSTISNLSITYDQIDLSDIIYDVIAELKSMDNSHNPQITIDNNMTIYADKNLIRILFYNLIHNSWKYTKYVSNPRIKLGQSTNSTHKTYFINDNGIGIDNSNIPEIFDEFKTFSPDQSKYSGKGIGLSIVKKIIDKHNGKIWVESNINQGTTFYFYI